MTGMTLSSRDSEATCREPRIGARSLSPLVFIVDDDKSTVRAIHSFLRRAGYRTDSAGDVAGALQGIRQQTPDLILLDVNLADGSGFEICRALQAEATAFAAPVLFISADESTATKIRSFRCGAVDYITKPVIGEEIIARVRTDLRLKRAYERLSELHAERVQRLASAQQDLMPDPGDVPDAHFHVSIRQVLAAGGDFYDVMPAGPGVVDYLVADASGHDLAASLWTASLKALAAEYAGPLNSPLEIVRAINASLCRFLPPEAFFTLLYARLDHQTGRLSVVNAGHPPPILVSAGDSAPVILRQEGDVAGVFPNAVFGVSERRLKCGDRVLLYTDGVIETGHSYELGLRRLEEACCSRRAMALREMVPAIESDVLVGVTPTDDTLLLGFER